MIMNGEWVSKDVGSTDYDPFKGKILQMDVESRETQVIDPILERYISRIQV
jgi:hypothetical protein